MSINQNHRRSNSRAKLTNNDTIESQFNNAINIQFKYFTSLSSSCQMLEQNIYKLQQRIGLLIQKERNRMDKSEESLQALKIKQFQFIIKELEQRISKQVKSENSVKEQLGELKRQNQSLKQKLSIVDNSLKLNQQKIQGLNKKEADKLQQLEDLRKKYQSTLSKLEKANQRPIHDEKIEVSINDYEVLEGKLMDLEKQYRFQIDCEKEKNKTIKNQLLKVQQNAQEQKIKNQLTVKQRDSIKMNKFELQIRLKQQSQTYSELEQMYNNLLTKSNANELRLHQQIHQLKTVSMSQKATVKQQKREYRQHLIDLVNWLNAKSGFVFSGNTTKQQFEETKKIIEKVMARKSFAFEQQIQILKTELESLKQKLEQKELMITALQQRRTNSIESEKDKSSDNGSFMNNKSSEKVQSENNEKIKHKIELLRRDLKQKQSIINDLQASQHAQFQKSKLNLISLQTMLSDKTNQCRKYELILKDKNSQIAELNKLISQNLAISASQIKRLQNDKESIVQIYDKKIQQNEAKTKTLKTSYRQLQKKQQQKTIKYNKLKAKYEKIQVQFAENLKRKNHQNDALLKQNSKLKVQNKILTQKIQLNEIIVPQQQILLPTQTPVNKDLMEQIQLQRDRILEQYEQRNQEFLELNKQYTNLKLQMNSLKNRMSQRQLSYENLYHEKSVLLDELSKLNQRKEIQAIEKQQENHSLLKKELEKVYQKYNSLKQLLKKCQNQKEQLSLNYQKSLKANSSKESQIQKLKTEIEKKTNQCIQISQNLIKMKDDFTQKLSQCAVKESQLIDIINYKNREVNNELRQSMRGEEQFYVKQDKQVNTVFIQKIHQMTNTQPQNKVDLKEVKIPAHQNKGIIEKYLLQNQDELYDIPQILKQDSNPVIQQQCIIIPQSNLFMDLQNKNDEDNFEICEQGQEINIGQTSINYQIKQIFIKLRQQIQKLFNEEDISYTILKILPKQLEDDYHEFVAYIREKIVDIKHQNNLSFIMADAGEQREIIEDIDEEIQRFLLKATNQEAKLRKILYQKEQMINSLINDKTQQEHTINQLTQEKEEMEEENQNRFMNQCNVYKKQIKEHKKYIDALEMDFQSMKNIFKNVFEIWIDQLENEDDLRDNLTLYAKIAKLSQVERSRMNLYLKRYKQVKGFQQQ